VNIWGTRGKDSAESYALLRKVTFLQSGEIQISPVQLHKHPSSPIIKHIKHTVRIKYICTSTFVTSEQFY
jgi:hypothetical protein